MEDNIKKLIEIYDVNMLTDTDLKTKDILKDIKANATEEDLDLVKTYLNQERMRALYNVLCIELTLLYFTDGGDDIG